MKYASIDIGTNTVLLMVAEVKERIEELYDIRYYYSSWRRIKANRQSFD